MKSLRCLPRKFSVLRRPLGTPDRQQRKPRLAQQAMRDGRLAMNELGASLRRVPELGSGQRMDAPAASVTRFHYGHSLARAGEFAGGRQACSACADDNDVVRMW